MLRGNEGKLFISQLYIIPGSRIIESIRRDSILKDNFRNSGFISGDMDKPSVNFKTIDSSHCKLPQFIIPDRTYDIALTTELAYMPCNIKRSSS